MKKRVHPLFFIAALLCALSVQAQPPAKTAPPVVTHKSWKGDLDGMLQRRYIRVLVVPAKLQYWVEKGQPSGATYEVVTAFEAALNKKYKSKTKHVKTHVVFVPVSRDELIPALKEGRGDIAAAGLTITPERLKEVDFGEPLVRDVKEIVLTGAHSPALNSIDDLSGKEVFVRKSSSYWSHLEVLNRKFDDADKKPIKLRAAPEDLQDEDLAQMLNAGLFPLAVMDHYKAALWAKVFPTLKAREDLVINEGGEIGWMIRKNSPKLKAEIDEFSRTHGKGTTFGNTIIRKYTASTRFVKPATSAEELRKYEATEAIFQKYGTKYAMDYLLMMAQGYQESRLDQNAKSHVGAIGVMQVMPATGKDMKVGDITQVDSNIHAGVKYIRFVRDNFYEKEPMTDLNKTLFAFAAYNCGPGRMNQLRREAVKRGLDQNVWFNNVELVAADKIGAETVTYVSNIYKYYIAYSLYEEQEKEREAARKALEKS